MITLFGIDKDGNCIHIYNGETNSLPEHLTIAQNILGHQSEIHYVAIVLERIETHAQMVSFGTSLLQLVCRSDTPNLSHQIKEYPQKNPVEELDVLISHKEWPEARKLLLSLNPLQVAHAILAARHKHESVIDGPTADEVDWDEFNDYLAGTYPSERIPDWCQMPEDEHRCVGGCWGILYGEVAHKGKEHCGGCEYLNTSP